jgi:hypothetical protein
MIAIIDVKTKDNKTYTIPDLNIFSKYPESVMWQTLTDGGLDMFQIFILSYLTYETLDTIVVFYERDIWPRKPRIDDVYDPFDFLGLPRVLTVYNSDDEITFMFLWWDNWQRSDDEYDFYEYAS